MNKSTVIYIRTASSENPITEQRQRALEYATETIDLDREDVLILVDRGTKARANDSSGYQRLSSFVAAGEVTRVIVTDASRIAKTMPDFYELVTALLNDDTAVHVIDVGLVLGEASSARSAGSQPDDQTVLWAIEIAAELDESVSTERTKEGIDIAKASGKHVGRPPFGFDSQAGQLVPDGNFETALEVIERIEAGKSKRSTARQAGISRATVQNIVDRTNLYLDHANNRDVEPPAQPSEAG